MRGRNEGFSYPLFSRLLCLVASLFLILSRVVWRVIVVVFHSIVVVVETYGYYDLYYLEYGFLAVIICGVGATLRKVGGYFMFRAYVLWYYVGRATGVNRRVVYVNSHTRAGTIYVLYYEVGGLLDLLIYDVCNLVYLYVYFLRSLVLYGGFLDFNLDVYSRAIDFDLDVLGSHVLVTSSLLVAFSLVQDFRAGFAWVLLGLFFIRCSLNDKGELRFATIRVLFGLLGGLFGSTTRGALSLFLYFSFFRFLFSYVHGLA